LLFGYFVGMRSQTVSAISNNNAILQIKFNISWIIFKKTCIFAFQIAEIAMIQRIQSIYLVIVVALGGLLPLWAHLWADASGTIIFAGDLLPVSIAFYGSAAMAVIAILQFKNRKNQFVMNRLNMILNLFLLGFFVYRSLNLSGETLVSEKGIGMLIPVFSIVFLVLANRAIKKDEDLVKSVDRLR